jgi:hypothetical protein
MIHDELLKLEVLMVKEGDVMADILREKEKRKNF